ncbi:hypothetical protein [Desulfofundulus thermosubterraneus]|uniref:Uncharacterized protein n=1 Tax=Desulfofundulus thermosubterraneus DSM 16057 TaxID=1121432 RepID=A0A1M6JA76_9FIRM|nr:hypothetical protein [Desulfofundulus thermosubterraneus]SHJ43607.1 hypothetical protein SAMN02745219_02554 [Desulfofundulus thermosubterraneus DSM 16057]
MRKKVVLIVSGVLFAAVVGFLVFLYYLGGKPPVVYTAARLAELPPRRAAMLADSGTVVKAHGAELVYKSDSKGKEIKGRLVPDAVIQRDGEVLAHLPDLPEGTRVRVLISEDRVLAVQWQAE